MSVVAARIVRRVIEVSRGPEPTLLEQAGLAAGSDAPVPAPVYYGLLERCAANDPTLPLRYGRAVRPEDFGAFGLALKTARDVGDVLQRLARYILVVSDTLVYTLHPDPPQLVLEGRRAGRRGIELANECALAAIVSLLRQVVEGPVVPSRVDFRHANPELRGPERQAHEAFFGCPVVFGAARDGLMLDDRLLATPTRLADDGLSAYLLAQLDAEHARQAEGAVVQQVRRVVGERLCTGMPSRDAVARQLGTSGRTLHRRLAEHGCSFQDVASAVRRERAESLLAGTTSLAEIAYLTGYADQSAFQRAFKAWTGLTPRAFRQQTS